MGVAIDDYILAKDIPGTVRIAAIMVVIYLLGTGFEAASGWMMAKISQGMLKQMRTNLFEHLQSLSLRFFDHNPAGELMSRLTNDIDAINQAVSQNLVSIIASTAYPGRYSGCHVRPELLAGAGFGRGGAHHVLVHHLCR